MMSHFDMRVRAGLAAAVGLAFSGSAFAQNHLEPSLKTIQIPEPSTISEYVADHAAAVRLGKALFWDVRLGSDGETACATCHHQAGVDSRTKNIFHPGADGAFAAGIEPGKRADASLFPLTKFADTQNRFSKRLQSINDVAGSAGVMREVFNGLDGLGGENCTHVQEPVFIDSAGVAHRQLTGRNAPSVINAVFNVRQFWDGRANAWFNGANPFGPVDQTARVWRRDLKSGGLTQTQIAIDHASLASQAVGPVNNDVEMAAHGRGWVDVARKLIPTHALASQKVSSSDSILGADARPDLGLNSTYAQLIDAAFLPEWRGATEVAPGTTLTDANMPLFFGLAVQLYEASLVSDNSRYDQFIEQDGVMGGAPGLLTEQELMGARLFFNMDPRLPRTNCQLCHMSAVFTGATYAGEGGEGPDMPAIGLFPGASDSDGDLVPDLVDAFPSDSGDWLDSDHDGIGNNADTDDDNDGILDSKDPCPLDPLNVPKEGGYAGGIYPPSPILTEHNLAQVFQSEITFREPPTGFEPSVHAMNFGLRGKGIDLCNARGTVVAHMNMRARRNYPSTLEENTVIPAPTVGEFSALIVDIKIVDSKMTLQIDLEDFPQDEIYTLQIDGVVRATLGATPSVLFEAGFDNIGVRPQTEDAGLGGSHPNGVALSPAVRAQTDPNLAEYGDHSAVVGVEPHIVGAFKVPSLRNIELTGPYFHNGGAATLEDVIRFYNRGGDFHEANADNLAPDMQAMGLSESHISALAAFLRTLTDERVRDEQAPFDHPALPLADGKPLAAVGAGGRPESCAKPIMTFVEALAESDPFAGDCDQNGQLDTCEIALDSRLDSNHNGILDTCEGHCAADINLDGSVNGDDLATLLAAWGMPTANANGADIDRSGSVDGADLTLLLSSWGTCP